jgi:hypothetical protein
LQGDRGDAPEISSAPKRKGGRPKGSLNRRTALGRDFLRSLQPRAKATLRALLEGEDTELQFRAARLVMEYCFGKPIESRELTGADGERLFGERVDDAELARRLALLLSQASKESAASPCAADGAQAREGGDSLAPPLAAPPPKVHETSAPAVAGGAGAEDGSRRTDPLPPAEPQAPPPGYLLRLGNLAVLNHGPSRPGNPDLFDLCQGHADLRAPGKHICSGSFDRCLSMAKKLLGEELPRGRTEQQGPAAYVRATAKNGVHG